MVPVRDIGWQNGASEDRDGRGLAAASLTPMTVGDRAIRARPPILPPIQRRSLGDGAPAQVAVIDRMRCMYCGWRRDGRASN